VAGDTTSVDFPVQSAVQSAFGGRTDAFITKFTPAGLVLFSTYLGGSADEHAGAIAIGQNGVIYVAGGTFSSNFPVRARHSPPAVGPGRICNQPGWPGSPIFFSTYLGARVGLWHT
jgi:hypothetical protein